MKLEVAGEGKRCVRELAAAVNKEDRFTERGVGSDREGMELKGP